MCYFFFFQAEDGIRDLTVTGVQTCALPISPRPAASVIRSRPRSRGRWRATPHRTSARARGCRSRIRVPGRSEERRVGKSVDLGGRRIIKKKKKKDIKLLATR